MKDNFSEGADRYAQFRPTYPDELYERILSFVPNRSRAWDCGTGNGQVASRLSEHFSHVCATDISSTQLAQAISRPNITYAEQPAEQTDFDDQCFDLIVVAQAIHWFDFDRFYAEVRRTLRPGGLLTAIGYDRPMISEEVDATVSHLYHEVVGPYWDAERSYIDGHYRTIPFPFQEVEIPEIFNTMKWQFNHLLGYLGTWSAVRHFKRDTGQDPIALITPELKIAWGDDVSRAVSFPIFLRAGKSPLSSDL